MAAVPYIIPLRIQSTVFFPITLLGRSSRIPGSWAVREVSASSETRLNIIYQKNKKAQDSIRLTGANIDYAA